MHDILAYKDPLTHPPLPLPDYPSHRHSLKVLPKVIHLLAHPAHPVQHLHQRGIILELFLLEGSAGDPLNTHRDARQNLLYRGRINDNEGGGIKMYQ